MVELTNPLMHEGHLVPSGTKIQLADELEKNLIDNGNAIFFDEFPQEPAPEPPQEPAPEPPQEPAPEPIPMGRRIKP